MPNPHRLLAATIAILLSAALSTSAAAPARAASRCARRLAHLGGAAATARPRAICRRPTRRRAAASVPVAAIVGPVEGGRGSPTLFGTSFDLAEVGYEQSEYFVEGVARAFLPTAPLGPDGRWRVTPGETAAYRTRVVVHRPIDPRRFDGTVFVEWLNVSGGLDAAPDWTGAHTEITRQGAVWVGVSAQRVGVEGGGVSLPGLGDLSLKGSDPERYGSLVHPGDSFSYDLFAQVGRALRSPKGPDPLGGLRPERVIAVGESQSAFRLTTYANAIAPLARVYDGFLIHSRGGGSARLSQPPQPEVRAPEVVRIRTDLEVPVLLFETETDLIGLEYLPDRQRDTRRIRLWEVAGTAHVDTYTLATGVVDRGDDPSAADLVVTSSPIPGIFECARPVNSGPQHWVLNAAFAALERWVRRGVPPRPAPRLEVVEGTPPAFVLDPLGNVRGGIRTPWVDAPIAVLSGLGQEGAGFCFLAGTTSPLDATTLEALYPDHESYVAAVRRSAEREVRRGFLLAADADLIVAAAGASDIGR